MQTVTLLALFDKVNTADLSSYLTTISHKLSRVVISYVAAQVTNYYFKVLRLVKSIIKTFRFPKGTIENSKKLFRKKT